MYKVKIPLFLRGMEELAAGLNALRQWQLHKGGGNERKGEGCWGKGGGKMCGMEGARGKDGVVW